MTTAHKQHLFDRLDAIAAALRDSGAALALLGLGSVGRETDRIDDYSDLDFFAIVQPGQKARGRARWRLHRARLRLARANGVSCCVPSASLVQHSLPHTAARQRSLRRLPAAFAVLSILARRLAGRFLEHGKEVARVGIPHPMRDLAS